MTMPGMPLFRVEPDKGQYSYVYGRTGGYYALACHIFLEIFSENPVQQDSRKTDEWTKGGFPIP